jgi:4-alpha-glucanotransferase
MDNQMVHRSSAQGTAGSSAQSILAGAKKAGMGIHFSSLPGPFGIGDIGDSARAFVDILAGMNIDVWQFLPTGPTAYGDSPYQPLSAFAGNEMLIGIEPLVRLGLLTEDEPRSLAALPVEYVDYGQLIPIKKDLLNCAADRFTRVADAALKADYEAFLALHDSRWLNDYAVYRILKSLHDERPWPEWDDSFVRRETGAMQQLQKRHRDAIERVKITQFLFDRQWRALKRHAHEHFISLFGDMPIYIALDSADAWAHPEILLLDNDGRPSHVAGVPPDYFSADGQLWGNPLYDWKFHEANGFGWWIERMQHAANQMDMVRVDHFRGFESFWAVPYAAQTARQGEWLPGPGDALFEAMRSVLGGLPVVAEDLGLITAEVDELRLRHGIPGMKVLQFLVDDPAFNPDQIADNSVCYTGTHDNDTTAGWFAGEGSDLRNGQELARSRENALRFTRGSADTISVDMIRLAFGSDAKLAVAPMQDFLGLGSEARMNTPGTTSDNWRWRVTGEQLSAEFCDDVANLVEEMGRA